MQIHHINMYTSKCVIRDSVARSSSEPQIRRGAKRARNTPTLDRRGNDAVCSLWCATLRSDCIADLTAPRIFSASVNTPLKQEQRPWVSRALSIFARRQTHAFFPRGSVLRDTRREKAQEVISLIDSTQLAARDCAHT